LPVLNIFVPQVRHTPWVAAFLGSSGVSKSALINALLGVERREVGRVRGSDRKGRHTASRRELILLPGGGAVIDTLGMREIQMWIDEDNPVKVFEGIERLAVKCRFADCRHGSEPGCAVRVAIQQGDLDVARLQSYLKLQREFNHLAARQDDKLRLEAKSKRKRMARLIRQSQKQNR